MGYNITQVYSNFEIPEEYAEDAIIDIKRQYRQLGLGNLKDIFDEFSWDISKEGNKWTDLQFLGEKWNEDHLKLFQLVAPYVPAGCYIQMQGEDGEMWRWVFDGKDCKEVTPEIRWEY